MYYICTYVAQTLWKVPRKACAYSILSVSVQNNAMHLCLRSMYEYIHMLGGPKRHMRRRCTLVLWLAPGHCEMAHLSVFSVICRPPRLSLDRANTTTKSRRARIHRQRETKTKQLDLEPQFSFILSPHHSLAHRAHNSRAQPQPHHHPWQRCPAHPPPRLLRARASVQAR